MMRGMRMNPAAARLGLLLVTAGLATACAHAGEEAARPAGAGGAAAVRLEPGERRIAANGVELVVHIAGSGPVVLAHPGGPGSEWSYLRMPEVEKAFTVVYIEPLGTGKSGRPASPSEYSMDRYVADIDAIRAQLGLERFILLGHSHGGFVAQAYAIAHGDRLSRLVLYDTSPTTGPEWQKDIEHNLAWFEHEPWFAGAKKALAEETSAETDEQMTDVFHREAPLYFADYTHRKGELDPLIARMQLAVGPARGSTDPSAPREVGVAPVFDVRAELAGVAVPTLILVGRKDFVCSLEMAKIMDERIPDSRVVILEHSGHMGHIEEPDTFARAVIDFAAK
jgi:proline iminopeptidase